MRKRPRFAFCVFDDWTPTNNMRKEGLNRKTRKNKRDMVGKNINLNKNNIKQVYQ
jgi:hypothetical protein